MDAEFIEELENRVENLLLEFTAMRQENALLREENQRLVKEREGFKSRIDVILKKMEGI
ncbi:MAG: cell division protein ZapB [Deltaproteobacteria bacterium]|jgi:cell division protein ZapB|nr:cell division protein ZapB [Deltaproteobacteria bacterium]